MARSNKVIRLGQFEDTPSELDHMFAEADRRGRERLEQEPLATKAVYDRETRRVVLWFNNGAKYEFSADLLQFVSQASDAERAKLKIFGYGTSIDWPRLDVEFEVTSLLAGRFGNRQWMDELRHQGKIPPAPVANPSQPSRRSKLRGTTRTTTRAKPASAKSSSRTRRVVAAGH